MYIDYQAFLKLLYIAVTSVALLYHCFGIVLKKEINHTFYCDNNATSSLLSCRQIHKVVRLNHVKPANLVELQQTMAQRVLADLQKLRLTDTETELLSPLLQEAELSPEETARMLLASLAMTLRKSSGGSGQNYSSESRTSSYGSGRHDGGSRQNDVRYGSRRQGGDTRHGGNSRYGGNQRYGGNSRYGDTRHGNSRYGDEEDDGSDMFERSPRRRSGGEQRGFRGSGAFNDWDDEKGEDLPQFISRIQRNELQ